MNTPLMISGLAVALTGASLSGPASAGGGNEASGSLEEIVVTAEKRNSTVQETPISMTAISGDQLMRQGTQTIEQLVGNVPGVSMRTAGPGQTEYEIRGLASSGGSTATVGFYIDDTILSASGASQSAGPDRP